MTSHLREALLTEQSRDCLGAACHAYLAKANHSIRRKPVPERMERARRGEKGNCKARSQLRLRSDSAATTVFEPSQSPGDLPVDDALARIDIRNANLHVVAPNGRICRIVGVLSTLAD
jgi:hypothetical protein